MKNLTWQNPEQLFVAQVLINKVKSKCCGIKVIVLQLASAFNMIVETHSVTTFEHALTIALPLCAALIVAFMPVSVSDSLPAMLRPILTNGFVVGVLLVVFVEHFVFLKRN